MLHNLTHVFSLTALVLVSIPSPVAVALHLEQVNPQKPSVAICITGTVSGTFSRTAANLKSVLVDNLQKDSDAHVFIYVKCKGTPNEQITYAVESLQPMETVVYSEEEPFYKTEWPGSGTSHMVHREMGSTVPAIERYQWLNGFNGTEMGYLQSAWIQRYQWLKCWDMVVSSESRLSRQYDFVLRTRPDLLFSPIDFVPSDWGLWHANAERKKTAYGVCKCRRADLVDGFPTFPVQDVFFVGRRDAAALFMTTWTRRENITKTHIRKCWMYYDIRDYFECVTVADLAQHGYSIEAIPEISSLKDQRSHRWAFEACQLPAAPWAIFHHLPEKDQHCINQSADGGT
jgi:hypothetical protein